MADTLTPRGKRICAWMDTVPSDPPFYTRPEFRFFGNITKNEATMIAAEMRRRAAEDRDKITDLQLRGGVIADRLADMGEERKALVLQKDADGYIALRFADPADDREREIELRFPVAEDADLYVHELIRLYGKVFGPIHDETGRAA